MAFVFSPLVGSPITTSAKFAVVSRSPLTERINDSLASSHFAIAGKRMGTILGYAAIAATVGMVLRFLSERSGLLGRIVIGFIGVDRAG